MRVTTGIEFILVRSVTKLAPYARANTTASLYTIVSGNDINVATAANFSDELDGQLRINFPAMPETLTLARQANYENLRSPAAPDGFHWYRNTEPLAIPVKFSLAGFDRDYCRDDGPYALLDIAAKLHAMTMPIVPATSNSTKAAPAVNQVTVNANEARLKSEATTGSTTAQPSQATSGGVQIDSSQVTGLIFFPPACVLSIILAEMPGRDSKLGIQCVGFVSSVDVTFHGPWLQSGSARGAAIVNMPSRADFEFKFTHQPNYTNTFMAGGNNQRGNVYTTTAEMVRGRLYNQFSANTPQANSLAFADLFGRTGVTPGGK